MKNTVSYEEMVMLLGTKDLEIYTINRELLRQTSENTKLQQRIAILEKKEGASDAAS